ncbi:unnamed protein product [Paramecium pentaurelia]|uniref:Transmembrane protein n=1 Tax=Paramecium pentaurelia TaxID=43138 RepID=A0A8S1UK01_9CILI|nr:unnamed protein product [Paramecium pentaurelia]
MFEFLLYIYQQTNKRNRKIKKIDEQKNIKLKQGVQIIVLISVLYLFIYYNNVFQEKGLFQQLRYLFIYSTSCLLEILEFKKTKSEDIFRQNVRCIIVQIRQTSQLQIFSKDYYYFVQKQSLKFQDNFSSINPSIVSEGDKNVNLVQSIIEVAVHHQSQFIQFLIQENLQLKKQNSDKEKIIIKFLIRFQQRAIISKYRKKYKYIIFRTLGNNVRTIQSQLKMQSNNRVSKEFQIALNQRQFYI